MKGKSKSKSVWWVLTQQDSVFIRQYSGTDRAKVRSVAAKLLSDEKRKEDSVIVCRVSRLTILEESSLERSLPKDAF